MFLKMQESFALSEASHSGNGGFCIIESWTRIDAARVGIEEDLISFVEDRVV